MLLPNQEHLPRSDHESSGYESKASYLISTSNHNAMVDVKVHYEIVSYLISTSNHNAPSHNDVWHYIASYLISTSNHNKFPITSTFNILLLISFLHQTTTRSEGADFGLTLLLISFLHQTTTLGLLLPLSLHCFLSHFYIKPQPSDYNQRKQLIASYLISTSNHNLSR